MTATAEAVRERPILFSGPMVRAILDGRKTQTRRIADEHNSEFGAWGRHYFEVADFTRAFRDGIGSGSEYLHVPVKPGTKEMDGIVDRLYPRFAPAHCWDQITDTDYTPPASRLWVREKWTDDTQGGFLYAADPIYDGMEPCDFAWRWSPSIFMPRRACRLTLRVTDVRVQRLQDISEEDAQAEGMHPEFEVDIATFVHGCAIASTHRLGFKHTWDSLNAKRGYGWDVNPWVWVVSFEREA